VQWYPEHVKVSLYNQAIAKREEIILEKRAVAIVENPLYPVMNETNSTLQRLLNKLELLDAIDNQSASGKLDLIIQLPYVIKSEARRQQAEQRRADIEFQLKGSQYGIAYTDGTEKITQLNRPAENNLMAQIEFLTEMLYGQLGLTEEVMNGTADEKAMLNYWNRTIEPILTAIVESMRRTFLTKTARTQGQTIQFFRDPFRLVPIENIAEIADKFTRNEIMSSNEMRQVVGLAPHNDPKADQLVNSNMPQGNPSDLPQEGSTNGHASVLDLIDNMPEVTSAINDAKVRRSSQNGS
jgi:putative sterol carrier protein